MTILWFVTQTGTNTANFLKIRGREGIFSRQQRKAGNWTLLQPSTTTPHNPNILHPTPALFPEITLNPPISGFTHQTTQSRVIARCREVWHYQCWHLWCLPWNNEATVSPRFLRTNSQDTLPFGSLWREILGFYCWLIFLFSLRVTCLLNNEFSTILNLFSTISHGFQCARQSVMNEIGTAYMYVP